MTWSFPVGRVLGTEIRIHATFFLLLLWIAVGAYFQGGTALAISNLAFILALFACVLAHEFGHILMARRYGIPTPDVTLLPIGGMARLDRIPEKPMQEIAVALAGPAVNVAIWLVLTLALGAETRLAGLENIDDPSQGFLARLAAVNIFLVLFNMIPAFPMDGGRVFRAAVALWVGRARATRIAAMAGQIIAFFFGLGGLMTGNPILVLIAVFVFVAASSESADVAMRELARNMKAREAMITTYESLVPDDTVQAATAALIRTTQHEFPVSDADGRVVGFVDRNAIFAAVSADGAKPNVADMMVRDFPSVTLTAPLQSALDLLFRSQSPAVAVTNRDGTMIGYITRENIGELMVVAGQTKR
ncbi:MAG: site-2 protease family protein [Paracoccaceae bacterium]